MGTKMSSNDTYNKVEKLPSAKNLIKQLKTNAMNRKQLNLDLTVSLMNLATDNASLLSVSKAIGSIKNAGKLLKTSLVSKKEIGVEWTNKTYAFIFENCAVNIDLIANRKTRNQILGGFQVQ